MSGLQPCGTEAAYCRHIRAKEPIDEACRVAHNTYSSTRLQRKDAQELAPCGTPAAARRHKRRGEPLDYACRVAESYREAVRRARSKGLPVPGIGAVADRIPDTRAVRNGLPQPVGYVWRARTYPWAQRAIARAEAIHGQPEEAA